jgi:hypothetical protein
MIIESGHYEYDSELDEYYNLKNTGSFRLPKDRYVHESRLASLVIVDVFQLKK